MTTTAHRTMTVDGLAIFDREAGPVRAPPTVEELEYIFDCLADVRDGFVQQLGLAPYSLYVTDDGAPVGFRLAVKHPERVQALIVQNGNAYAEGLGECWQPFRVYWHDRTDKNAAPLTKVLTLESTKWQYTHGVHNAEAISPDHGIVDQSVQDRPGNKAMQLQLFYDYGAIPRGIRSGKPIVVPLNRQRSWSGASMIPSCRPQAPIHTRGTCTPLRSISWIPNTSPWKRMAR